MKNFKLDFLENESFNEKKCCSFFPTPSICGTPRIQTEWASKLNKEN